MKKVVVFGASGRVGQKLVQIGLEKGLCVTAFMRSGEGVPAEHENFRLIVGDMRDDALVHEAVTGQDGVFFAPGPRNLHRPITILSESIAGILQAMRTHDVHRIVVLGGAGILQDNSYQLRMERPDFPPFLMYVMQDHLRVYDLLRRSDRDWTLTCPVNIVPDDPAGMYVVRVDYFPEPGHFQISAGDVADCMMAQFLEGNFIRRRVGIAGL
ncbi:MAG: NAD(P)H-binding protein [Bacteroidia bacterium]|nr:NAD(P)H-binding protein [Bacteroidia bacterium]